MPSSAAHPWPVEDFTGLLKDLSILFGFSTMVPTLLIHFLGAWTMDWILFSLGAAFFGPLLVQMVLLNHRKTYIDSLERKARVATKDSVPKPLSLDEQKKENMLKSAEGLEWARKAYENAQEQHRKDRAGYFNRNRQDGTLLDGFKLMHFIVSDDIFGGLKGAMGLIYSLFKQLSEKIDLACNTKSHVDIDANKDVLQHPPECSDDQNNIFDTDADYMHIYGHNDERRDKLYQETDSKLEELRRGLDYCNRFHAVKPSVQHFPDITPEASSSNTESDQATPERFSSCTLIRNISKAAGKEILIYDKDTGLWSSDRGSNAQSTTTPALSDTLLEAEADPHTYFGPTLDAAQHTLKDSSAEATDVVGWDNDAGEMFWTQVRKLGGREKSWDDSAAW